jgi:hypothetical protein
MCYEKVLFQFPNAKLTFFDCHVIYHSSLVKGAVNAARVCKLRNGVKKTHKFLLFSQAKGKRP